ncbi:hypothetical protein CJA_0962 [Cellvibrio japonicus Ueda107]|uniref:Uncharacterized protein n=1 Tax=Cellvibrio japonicus (strain Ueda107) TaxID=498211 RepID=B3PLD8_CELJU|nr:hypothetical protein CJA_0962 [Cellvibrio japonicus Ueda107]
MFVYTLNGVVALAICRIVGPVMRADTGMVE